MTRHSEIFGNLFNDVSDYVLVVLVSDIVRHLLVNNFGVLEVWGQSGEDVLKFPASEDLCSATISQILDVMGSSVNSASHHEW